MVAALLALSGAAVELGRTAAAPPQPVTISVTQLDSSCILSRRTVPLGSVRFVVANRSKRAHQFSIDGVATPVLRPGQLAVLQLSFERSGSYAYRCAAAGQTAPGLKGDLTVIRPTVTPTLPTTAPSPTTPTPTTPPPLQLTEIGTFDRPTAITSPPDDPDRLFIVEQSGVIRLVVDGVVQPVPFLDITSRVAESNEKGLLGLAFAPDYATSGRFYIDFTAPEGNGDIHVEEYRRSANDPNVADPASVRTVLTIVKPWENHNAGMLQFGTDGYLYIAVGDGDSGVTAPPGKYAQTLDDLLGDILRIDPRQAGDEPYTVPRSNPFVGDPDIRPEIWDYGFRNPWRFWLDAKTGDLYIGDVGDHAMEEIDYEQPGRGGLDYGWPCMEGTAPYISSPDTVCPNPVAPLVAFDHTNGVCAVIVGVVMHDPRLPALDSSLVYTDLCGGKIESLRVADRKVAGIADLGLTVSKPTSFGEDGLGRVYVASLDGPLYRIDPS